MPENKADKKQDHRYYMRLALEEAKKAGQMDEVPIGSVIVAESGKVISAAGNATVSSVDPTSHAEIRAIRKAAEKTGNYRLNGATLYTTIEPCIMCMGAVIHARLKCVVFGAYDDKWGGAGSLYDFADDDRLNHRLEIVSGICADECRQLIQSFFHKKREKKRLLKKETPIV